MSDAQLYLPLEWKDANSIAPLLDFLEDVRVWMALHFLKFNERKTEVMVFGPGNAYEPPYLDLSAIKSCC